MNNIPVQDKEISFYKNVFEKKSLPMTVGDFLMGIKVGEWREVVENLRSKETKEERDKLKHRRIPAVTVSGTFGEVRRAAEVIEKTNLIALDVDKVDDPDTIKAVAGAEDFVVAAFTSVSGTGVCIICRIEEKADYLKVWMALDEYFATHHNIHIDPACKDISRLRFVSFDPEIYVNFKATAFKFKESLKKTDRPRRNSNYGVFATEEDYTFVVQQIVQAKRDIAPSYAEWRDVGFALADGLGEAGRDYFHAVSQFHPKYDAKNVDQHYTRFLRGKGTGITKSTFFHKAKQAGFSIVSPKTNHILGMVKAVQHSAATPEEAAELLHGYEGFTPAEAKPIIDAVYANPKAAPDGVSPEIILENIVNRYGTFRYNTLTSQLEMNGEPFYDRDLNTLYIHVRKSIPEKTPTKELLSTLLESDFTPEFDPLTDFCERAPSRLKTDNPRIIRTLASCIDTGDQDPAWAVKALTLWMTSLAESWLTGNPNPYMLLLIGTQHGSGKTHFFTELLPESLKRYFAQIALTGKTDDAIISTQKAMILLDEMAGLKRMDWNLLKQMLTQKEVTAREAYGRYNRTRKRVASWCGTSNQREILRDQTGNRRFLPINVERIDHDIYNSVNKDELFWEAVWLYRAGFRSKLGIAEYNEISDQASYFREVAPDEEVILRYYGLPHEMPGHAVTEISATEIHEFIEFKTRGSHKFNSVQIGKTMTALGFKLEIKRIDGKVKRVYRVVDREGQLMI